MRLRTTLTRIALLVPLVVALLAGAPIARAAAGTWSPVPYAWSAAFPVHDVWAFGATGIAAVGNGGRIYLTRDGGATWDVTVPPGGKSVAFTAVALDSAGNGAVAAGSLMLVSSDGGATWGPPAYAADGGPTSVNDLALLGAHALAACDGGVMMESNDGGKTWSRAAVPPANDLTCVAIAGDGTAVAGGSGGEVLVERGGVWATAGVAAGPVTSVTAASAPVWGDGAADLFVATAAAVLGSDDAVTFAPLAAVPDIVGPPLLTWIGVPKPTLLLAAGATTALYSPATGSWQPGDAGLQKAYRAAAPVAQSVAYVLGEDGRLNRTLSAGLSPGTLTPSRTRLVVGATTRLSATVAVGAKGVLSLQARAPGGRWLTVRSLDWRAGDWRRAVTFDASPSLTRDYRLAFTYGAVAAPLTPITTIVVAPKVTTSRSRYGLRVGDVFRFSGSVTPALPGERIELLTDRGGGWRQVSGQARVTLRNGRAWSSRAFGTPRAETYRLRAHLPATKKHAEAWSRIVTVTIRR